MTMYHDVSKVYLKVHCHLHLYLVLDHPRALLIFPNCLAKSQTNFHTIFYLNTIKPYYHTQRLRQLMRSRVLPVTLHSLFGTAHYTDQLRVVTSHDTHAVQSMQLISADRRLPRIANISTTFCYPLQELMCARVAALRTCARVIEGVKSITAIQTRTSCDK